MRSRITGKNLGITEIAIREFPESKASLSQARMEEEAGKLNGAIPPGALIFCLDEHGQLVDSAEFSKLIDPSDNLSFSEAVFVIGGPDGLSKTVLNRARKVLALGKMTWPHQIARLLLLEQIYRSTTILSGHPYHRI